MKIGFIGLGKMGKAMVLQLLEKGVDVVAYNRTQQKIEELSSEFNNLTMKQFSNEKKAGKLDKAYSIKDLVEKLKTPRIIWLMVEHGNPVDDVIKSLISFGIEKNDIVIDGGNSFYKDSVRRYEELKRKGINYLDIGTSGGLEGARSGACVMVGGEEKIFHIVKPILEKISVPGGVAYFGPAGAGHFVKMVHNGIEYGMLQAIGEGFEILEKGPYKLDLHKIALNYTKGSVVRGWLMELLERALRSDPKLENLEGVVGGGSTGEWALKTAYELRLDAPVLAKSLLARKKSQGKPTFSGKVVAALRNQFGGHDVRNIKHITYNNKQCK